MHAQATSLTDQNIADIAAYLSSLATAATARTGQEERGQRCLPRRRGAEHVRHAADGSRHGQEKATMFRLHGKDGQATAPNTPRLAGQYQNYMAQALHEYKTASATTPS